MFSVYYVWCFNHNNFLPPYPQGVFSAQKKFFLPRDKQRWLVNAGLGSPICLLCLLSLKNIDGFPEPCPPARQRQGCAMNAIVGSLDCVLCLLRFGVLIQTLSSHATFTFGFAREFLSQLLPPECRSCARIQLNLEFVCNILSPSPPVVTLHRREVQPGLFGYLSVNLPLCGPKRMFGA